MSKRLTPAALVLVGMVSYTTVVGTLAAMRHVYFGSNAYDLGIYDQALWLIHHGRTPFVTIRDVHILGDHFTPILYPLSLIYGIGHHATTGLLWLQTGALASGAWPLYRMGTHLSGSPRVGLLAGASYLLYPPLRAMNLFDFHPVALATPGVLFAAEFALERRAWPLLAAFLWTALCRQEAALVAGSLGLWYAIRWRRPAALLLFAAGIVWFVAAIRLQAHFAGVDQSAYLELYSRFGDTPAAMLRTFLLRPWVPLSALLNWNTPGYLIVLLAPLAFLPLREPGLLAVAAFPLALNLFSNREQMRQIDYHYTALLTPVLFSAATAALARMSSDPEPVVGHWSLVIGHWCSATARLSRARLAAAAWAGCALIAALTILPLHAQVLTYCEQLLPRPHAKAMRGVLGIIPRNASVAATSSLAPQLSQRRELYLYPNPFVRLATGPGRLALREILGMEHRPVDRAVLQAGLSESRVEYLALSCRLGGGFPMLPREEVTYVAEGLRNPSYGVIAAYGDTCVLKRGADHASGLAALGLKPADPPEQFERRVWSLMIP